MIKSQCCKAEVKVENMPDFDTMGVTNCCICSVCKKACDIYTPDDTQKHIDELRSGWDRNADN